MTPRWGLQGGETSVPSKETLDVRNHRKTALRRQRGSRRATSKIHDPEEGLTMTFVNLRKSNHSRRAWALIGEAGTGKSTFTTQLRDPLLVIDADGRYQEVEHHHRGAVLAISDRPADLHDPLRIAEILDENMPNAEVGTIELDSMTPILSPIVTRILEELERGCHKNRSAAWKPKATAVRLIQDALNKWKTDFVIIYHEQERINAKGRQEVAKTVSDLEEARLLRSLNARIRLGQDAKGRYAEVIWSRTGRTGKVYDQQGMWKGVPERLDELIWGNLSQAEEALTNGAAPAAFADPQAAWDWGVSQGCFRGIEHARNAYEKLKTEQSPQNAGQMRDLWVAEVQRRVNGAEHTAEPEIAGALS
jgi:hypothetical protein